MTNVVSAVTQRPLITLENLGLCIRQSVDTTKVGFGLKPLKRLKITRSGTMCVMCDQARSRSISSSIPVLRTLQRASWSVTLLPEGTKKSLLKI